MNKLVLPISGGMDSSVLLHKAVNEFDSIYCLTFDYGQRHKKEIEFAHEQIKHALKKNKNIHHRVLDVKFLRELAPTSSLTNDDIPTPDVAEIMGEAQPKTYVPNRNMMFLSICAAHAEAVGADTVWHGAAQADSLAGYWDGSPEFLESVNSLLNLNRDNPVTIEAPLINLSKADIVIEGITNEVVFSKTWTCYDGDNLPDSRSASSSLRLQGFIEAGYADPCLYKDQKRLIQVYKERGVDFIPYETYTFKNLVSG
jgi:7-cyano-7-deazaguanine synthase